MVSTHSTSWVSVGKASAILGCSVPTVRSLCDSGELKTVRTRKNGFGHRRIALYGNGGLYQWLGYDETGPDNDSGETVVGYVRVSSTQQKAAGALDSQEKQVREYLAAKHGIPAKQVTIYSECASSFGNRPVLNSLLQAIIAGKVKTVVVTYADRWSRTPALTSALASIMETYGCGLEIINGESEDESKDTIRENMEELVAYVTVLSCRASGRKAGKLLKKRLDPEAIRLARGLYNSGHPIDEIVRVLNRKGYRATNKRGDKPSRISRHVLETVLEEDGSKLVEAPKMENSFERFFNSCVVHVEERIDQRTGKASRSCRLLKKDLVAAYGKWYRKNRRADEPKLTDHAIGTWLRSRGIEKTWAGSGLTVFKNIALRAK